MQLITADLQSNVRFSTREEEEKKNKELAQNPNQGFRIPDVEIQIQIQIQVQMQIQIQRRLK